MGFHLLLVDPDAGLVDEVRRAFAPVGFSVTALGAGEPAVEHCRQEPPDLILLAAELPDMSGFSVCNRLKRALPSVPLLLYTAEATDAAIDAHRGTRSRADDYLKKPFEVADLLARAAALLQTDPSAPPPPEPPAPPRPDGHRARPAPAAEEAPPVLHRVDSGQVAARGLASALAAASAPEGAPRKPAPPAGAKPAPGGAAAPPPIPPPVPGHKPQAPLGRVRVQAPGKDPFEFLSEWPRDPAPPKGTPEEKLEYFRDRLRARDLFLGKVRDSVADVKAYAAQLAGERDLLQRDLDQERARAAELEHRLQEASQDAAAQQARIDDLKRQLEETDATRQSISDVLSQAMQEKEAAEQEGAARFAAADAERARLEAELAERSEAHARATAAVEAERADERARLEAQRAETEEAHARALDELRAELERERTDSGAKLALAEERITALGVERDALLTDVRRLETDSAAKDEASEGARRQADEELAGVRAKLDEADGRAQATSGELAEAQGRIEALEQELRIAGEAREATAGELRAARAEAKAYEEKALAAEHAWQAKAAELGAAEQRVKDLSAALNEGRATNEGARGELSRIEGLRADAERRAAMAAAERDQLAREVESARREAEAAREDQRADRGRIQKLDGEVARLGRLEPVAEEAVRLRKEVASLRDIIQQRTSVAESSSRQAQTAASERARLEERLAVESGKLQAQVARLDTELGATRRRADELDRVLLQREAALKKATAELDERRRAQAGGTADAEKKHATEVARLKTAMVELEKHLEARARSELQLKKRVQELEKGGRPVAPEPVDVARMRVQLGKLAEDLDELKGENEFLNGEVARYVQKNKELAAKLAGGR